MKDEGFVWRFRAAVCCLLLAAMAMLQDPGRIVSDTKIDLSVAPGSFLARAWSLWDPVGVSGQVQNQAYGYFFPMGPFFWVGHQLGFDPWVVQRLWWALILIVAFLGFVKLVKVLGVGTQWAQLVGGFAFALSPRALSVIGPASIEVWPAALAPWVLVPLVVGLKRRSPLAMAAWSALAVTFVGGVNAAATFAVIPLGAIWLLMADRGPRRRTMMIAWPTFVAMGTLWWLIPLFVLGKYSPPFLDFIESASLTTFAGNLFDTMRGTSNWTAYLSDSSVAGRLMVSNVLLICNVAVVTAFGVAGLARRDNPLRSFLFVSLSVGLVLVTLGHTTTHGGIAAPDLQSLLDGVLAPLRNTHKFDVIVRLPLVIGFVHILSVATAEFADRGEQPLRWTPGVGVAVLAIAALVGATTPAWTGQLPNSGSLLAIPSYWKQTSDWLARNSDNERALLVPASSFGTYTWGTTNDDPLQPLARSPWAVRNAIPLAQPGNIRTLDAIESRFSDARGSGALARYLSDSGIGYLVVRNDLRGSVDGIDPEIVYQTLSEIPKLKQVAAFGPSVGGKPRIKNAKDESVFIDQGWQSRHRSVEIYRVGDAPHLRAQSSFDMPVVIGAPDTQLSLLEAGMLKSPAVLFAQDADPMSDPAELILTDGQRRQEAAFGRTHDNRSNSLSLTDSFAANRQVHDYDMSEGNRWLTTPVLEGAKRITASSARSWVNTTSSIDQSSQPWSAFDRDPMTAWTASRDDIGRRSWLRIDFDEPVEVDGATINVNRDPVESTMLSIKTDHEATSLKARGGAKTPVRGLSKPTMSLWISAPSTAGRVLSITDVLIPGGDLARPLELPTPVARWGSPDRILLTADTNYRSGCLTVKDHSRCASGEDGWGEDGRTIDRLLSLPVGRRYPLDLTVEPIGGKALDEMLQKDQLVTVSSSSQVVRSAQASVLNATDGRNKTAWVASADDARPRLTMSWVGKRPISRIKLFLDPLTAASRPTKVTLVFSDGSRRKVTLSSDGIGRFPKVRADGVQIRIEKVKTARNLNSDGSGGNLPVGVSEIGIAGLLPRHVGAVQRTWPCGSGPTVEVGGHNVKTSLRASPAELLTGGEFPARFCGKDVVALRAGTHRVRVTGSDMLRPVRLAFGLRPENAPHAVSVAKRRWNKDQREAFFPGSAGGNTMVVPENFNAGWRETSGTGRPIMVNGWQQGWQFDFDAGKNVHLVFAPNSIYHAGLLAGAGSLAALVALALVLLRSRGAVPVAAARRRRLSWILGAAVTIGALALLGGLTGLTIGVAGFVVGEVAARRVNASTLAAVIVGMVGIASAFRPWAGSRGWLGSMDWPQFAMALALGLMAGSVFGRPNRLRLFTGRSTKR